VIRGATSPGQQCWIGRRERSTSVPFPDDVLARRRRYDFRRHVQHLFKDRELLPRILQPLGRLRFFKEGQQLADLAQRIDRFLPHTQGHTARRSEEIAKHRHRMAFRILEQNGRACVAQHAIANLRHLETRIDFGTNTPEFADLFQLRKEIAKVVVFHGHRGKQMKGYRL
jgi:hypothetical protein